ncbi:thioredoxin-like protein clot [Phtheirospermum japonicum]|uniref:Thioredoxin-like protein clot n=1 Tax=Phtheirospermum japonicum TaxID=374723 RepID=A0A830CFM3_9LAMI|nr:thioredoxin-like protein clot [Phtheirospermum japonicum]
MPMKVLDATVSTFQGVFEKFSDEAPNNKANFILFLADDEPSTKRSWCPGHQLRLVEGSSSAKKRMKFAFVIWRFVTKLLEHTLKRRHRCIQPPSSAFFSPRQFVEQLGG